MHFDDISCFIIVLVYQMKEQLHQLISDMSGTSGDDKQSDGSSGSGNTKTRR